MIEGVYLIQMDSIYKGNEKEMAGANLFLSSLIEKKYPFIILTEYSGKTRKELAEMLRKTGLKVVNELDFYTSSMAAVDYVVHHYPERVRVAGIGGKGMKAAIEKGGFINDQKQPDLLFMGMNRNMTYVEYSYALQYLLKGAMLISTDSRKTMYADGEVQLGNGAIIKMLEYASGKKAEEFGRGTTKYLQETLRFLKQKPSDVIFVGDDFQKDILPAIELGMDTVLITHGEGIQDMGITDALHPTYIVEDLFGLAK